MRGRIARTHASLSTLTHFARTPLGLALLAFGPLSLGPPAHAHAVPARAVQVETIPLKFRPRHEGITATVRIQGHDYSFLVDTGSDQHVLSPPRFAADKLVIVSWKGSSARRAPPSLKVYPPR